VQTFSVFTFEQRKHHVKQRAKIMQCSTELFDNTKKYAEEL